MENPHPPPPELFVNSTLERLNQKVMNVAKMAECITRLQECKCANNLCYKFVTGMYTSHRELFSPGWFARTLIMLIKPLFMWQFTSYKHASEGKLLLFLLFFLRNHKSFRKGKIVEIYEWFYLRAIFLSLEVLMMVFNLCETLCLGCSRLLLITANCSHLFLRTLI